MNQDNQKVMATQQRRMSAESITIEEVKTKGQLKSFINLPRTLYKNTNSHYIMPLEAHVRMMLGKLGQPQKHLFLANRGTQNVARLAVKVHKVEGEERLHFGFFECDPNFPEAAKLLIEHAHSLYPHLELMGPYNFRQEDPYIGVLIEGFEKSPYFMMSYNHREYDKILMDSGVEKAMDLFTYELKKSEGVPQLIASNAAKAKAEGIEFRTLDPKNLRNESRIIAGIFNEALRENWGFEEFLESQIDEMVLMFKFFIDPRVVLFARHNGQDVGCLIMIPDFNHLIKPCRGRLTLGLIQRYLNRWKTTEKVRGYALGVLKKYQSKGLGSALTEEMFNICKNLPYEFCEISWVLASNGPMNELSKAMGGKQNKVYRIYKKAPVHKTIN